MSLDINIINKDDGSAVVVTPSGQLVTAAFDYSTPVAKTLNVINTAFNFIEPLAGHFIVITDIIVSAGKTVNNTTPAGVEIYQAEATDTITVLQEILEPQLIRADNLPLTGLNLKIPAGVWVNAKTDDEPILLTIMYYRVPV